MSTRRSAVVAATGTAVIFVLVQVGALAVVQPFAQAGFQPVSDPSNPANGVVYFVGILLATGVMLAAVRFGVQWLIRGLVLATATLMNWIVLTVLLERVAPALPGSAVAGVVALVLTALLYAYPEWYVIDAAGLVMGAGAAGLFGISFGILPAVILLTILAVYDAVSVYGTEHMLTLAENAMDLRLPVLFVVPTTLSYSFLEATRRTESADGDGDEERSESRPGGETAEGESADDQAEGGESREIPPIRDALFIGLGDAVMPTILAVSAAFFLDVPRYDLPFLLNLPALTTLVGTMVGLLGLQYLVAQGRAHAGLPLLNGGAITGYLVGAVLAGIPLLEALGLAPYL